jgi:hypothetical protein
MTTSPAVPVSPSMGICVSEFTAGLVSDTASV